jgi:formylglycine-generating enzyme required for sulfatase activity
MAKAATVKVDLKGTEHDSWNYRGQVIKPGKGVEVPAEFALEKGLITTRQYREALAEAAAEPTAKARPSEPATEAPKPGK